MFKKIQITCDVIISQWNLNKIIIIIIIIKQAA